MTCYNCGHSYMSNEQHLCYMRSFTSDLSPDKFIFYDFECTQVDDKHKPNFVVAHSICTTCEDSPVTSESTCNNCGSRCMICVTVCFGTPVLLADLFVLSPGYEVPPDLATVPPPFSMCGLRSQCPQRRFECSK